MVLIKIKEDDIMKKRNKQKWKKNINYLINNVNQFNNIIWQYKIYRRN